MLKKLLLVITSLSFLLSAAPSIVSVAVNPYHLHPVSGGWSGRVTYKLDPDGCDSAFVKLEIIPAAGVAALPLAETSGAIGPIHLLSKNHEREIFFKYLGVVAGQYVAKLTVDAITSPEMAQANAIVAGAQLGPMVAMFSGDGDFFETPGIGPMPKMRSQDGPHGYNKRYNEAATAFLTDGGMACTWDPGLAYEQGQAMAREFRAYDRNCALGPAMNIVWHPQLGRAFEYYSEDSYLSAKMGAAAVRGIQSQGVIATVKHYVCNNMENDRQNLSSKIDERSLRELFLPQFKESVIHGKALGLMTAFNAINGVFCTGNPYLMTTVLRSEWGFLGLSMSDWKARVSDVETSIKYGADILLPDRAGYTESNFSKYDINYARMHARNIIYANAKVGALKPGYIRKAFPDKLNSDEHKKLVRRLGAKALVLAKNEGKVLPIPKKGVKIFLTGPEINTTRLGGGDTFDWESSLVMANRKISPQQGITEALLAAGGGASTIVNNALLADYIIVAVGVHGEGEGKDRINPFIREDGKIAVTNALAVSSAKTVVLFTGGSAALPGAWSKAPAILICFGPGQEQGYSIADVLFGDVNPGGKLNVTFPATMAQTVNFQASNKILQYPPAYEAHGYFKVNAAGQAPLFNFGHGLSYTTFQYSPATVTPASIVRGDRVEVSLNVTNTGQVAGDEVVQLYLSLPSGAVKVRKQDLRGFKRVSLAPGQSTKVSFELTAKDMAYFQVGPAEFDGTGQWNVLPGMYIVRVGTSSKITPAPDQPSVFASFKVL